KPIFRKGHGIGAPVRSSSALLRGICECIDERAAGHGPARNALVAGNTPELQESLAVRAERVAAVAAKHAVAVDRDSCVPAEAIAAARAERLFGAAIPRELGVRLQMLWDNLSCLGTEALARLG
ncbi:MAG TPA: hypothetical protein VM822_03425, partial [Pseudolabrys sp.]|nr:hypothetical protein [Pseudolabrys sp.]